MMVGKVDSDPWGCIFSHYRRINLKSMRPSSKFRIV